MKKLNILFLCFFIFAVQARVIENPKCTFRKTTDIQITKVELLDTATLLTFKVTTPQNAMLAKNSYIQASNSVEKLLIRSTVDLPAAIGTRWNLKTNDPIFFTAIFPPIDPTTEKIDFSEPFTNEGQPWQFFGIKINEHQRTTLLPFELEGDWLKTDGSNLLHIAIYENAAVYDAKVWKYDKILVSDKNTEILLTRNAEKVKLSLKLTDNKLLKITDGSKKTEVICSLTKTKNSSYKPKDNQAFSENLFRTDTAIYCGYINGFTPNMSRNFSFKYENIINGEDFQQPVFIDENGYFESKIALNYPAMFTVFLSGIGNERILFEPGKRLFQLLTLEKRGANDSIYGNHNCHFMGDNAELNEEIHVAIGKNEELWRRHNLISTISIDSLAIIANNDYNKDMRLLDSYKKARNLSPKALTILDVNIAMKRASLLSDYLEQKMKALMAKKSPDILKQIQAVNKPHVDSINALSFVETVKRFPQAIIDYRFAATYRKLYSNNYFIPLSLMKTVQWTMFAEIGKMNVELSIEDKALIDTIAAIPELKRDSTSYKRLLPKMTPFITAHFTEMKTFIEDIGNKTMLNSAQSIFGENAMMTELIQANNVVKKIKKFTLLTDNQLDELNLVIKNPVILACIKDENNKILAKIATNKGKRNYNVLPTPDVNSDKMLSKLLEPFKGKVVYLDFWATWCGPCLRNIAEMKPLKVEMKAQNVAFVYITGNSSPVKTWENVIPDIDGTHYRLSATQWDELCKKYQVTSIPHAMIFNQQGEMVTPKIQGSPNEEVKTLLLSTLGADKVTTKDKTVENDKVFAVVDKMPQFPGGESQLLAFISTHLRYPVQAQRAGLQGRVIVQFTVDKDGKVKNTKVLKSLNLEMDEEAQRVISLLPTWIPGEQKGEKVAVYYTLPITFRLR